jgi:mannose/fructose/N-acetylgalactosamine-specific phosphotransferase system component IIC
MSYEPAAWLHPGFTMTLTVSPAGRSDRALRIHGQALPLLGYAVLATKLLADSMRKLVVIGHHSLLLCQVKYAFCGPLGDTAFLVVDKQLG